MNKLGRNIINLKLEYYSQLISLFEVYLTEFPVILKIQQVLN